MTLDLVSKLVIIFAQFSSLAHNLIHSFGALQEALQRIASAARKEIRLNDMLHKLEWALSILDYTYLNQVTNLFLLTHRKEIYTPNKDCCINSCKHQYHLERSIAWIGLTFGVSLPVSLCVCVVIKES